MTVLRKISSTSYWGLCSRKGLLPCMKLSMSTSVQGPNRYFPNHSTSVSILYRDSRCAGAIIWFSSTTMCS